MFDKICTMILVFPRRKCVNMVPRWHCILLIFVFLFINMMIYFWTLVSWVKVKNSHTYGQFMVTFLTYFNQCFCFYMKNGSIWFQFDIVFCHPWVLLFITKEDNFKNLITLVKVKNSHSYGYLMVTVLTNTYTIILLLHVKMSQYGTKMTFYPVTFVPTYTTLLLNTLCQSNGAVANYCQP